MGMISACLSVWQTLQRFNNQSKAPLENYEGKGRNDFGIRMLDFGISKNYLSFRA